jgi:hypothetical protein
MSHFQSSLIFSGKAGAGAYQSGAPYDADFITSVKRFITQAIRENSLSNEDWF